MVGGLISEHWIWCNVYPKYMRNVVSSICKLYDDFKTMQKTAKVKQTEAWVHNKAQPGSSFLMLCQDTPETLARA